MRALLQVLGPTFERVDRVPVDFLAEVLVGLALWAGLDRAVRRLIRSVAAFHLLNLYPLVWRVVCCTCHAGMLSIVCGEENGFVDMYICVDAAR